ncbi:MAG: HEAT repeat domain-containing protein, partial [Pirellulaceae bacterium]
MIHRRNNLIIAATLLVVATVPITLWAQNSPLPLQAGQDQNVEINKLVGVLQSDAELFDKVLACKRLAVIGDKTAVPALAALLDDEKLAHYGRYGLEPIPDPAVDQAFRDALDKLQGGHLVGVINSIGNRRDAAAVEALSKLLSGDDPSAAAAAATSLGRIGNPQCAEVLTKALGTAPAAIRSAVGDGCVTCAEWLFDEGNAEAAIGVYDALRKADVAKHLQLAATRGAILARKADGVPLLVEQLRSDDDLFFAAGLGAARELAEGDVAGALLAQLDGASPQRRLRLILALGDTEDAKGKAAVMAAAARGSSELRVAAIGALAKLADASAVPLLLKAAVDGDSDVAAAAQATLVKLPGKDVDEAIAGALTGDADRRVVMELAGKRRVATAVPALFKAADGSDQQLRLVAIQALGETIRPEDLQTLTSRLTSPKNADELAAVQAALRAASIRMPDREECAARLAGYIADAPPAVKVFLLELLAEVGGDTALKAVSGYARSSDDAIQDAATRVLGEWTGTDAAETLLELANSLTHNRYKIRTLRGYIRVVRQFVPDEEKPAMCQKAMKASARVQEKQLVLEVLGRVPSATALSQVVAYVGDDRLKKEAGFAAVAIGEKILDADPSAVAGAMEKVLGAGASGDTARRAKALLAKA